MVRYLTGTHALELVEYALDACFFFRLPAAFLGGSPLEFLGLSPCGNSSSHEPIQKIQCFALLVHLLREGNSQFTKANRFVVRLPNEQDSGAEERSVVKMSKIVETDTLDVYEELTF